MLVYAARVNKAIARKGDARKIGPSERKKRVRGGAKASPTYSAAFVYDGITPLKVPPAFERASERANERASRPTFISAREH